MSKVLKYFNNYTGKWETADGSVQIAPENLGTGTSITTKYLRGDGTWQTISSGGVSDGDKGDIVVSGSGSVWALDSSITAEINNKAPLEHTHIIGDVTGLQTALDAKAASSHNHAASEITSGIIAPARIYTLVATLASDQATGANTTPVTLSGLVFSYEANSKYRIWAMGTVSPAAATTGCGFQFDLSSAVTSISVQFYHQLASTGTLSGGHSIADDASVGVSSGFPGTSNYPVTVDGILITGANTGTAQLRFRSETNAVITCRAGFTLVIEKIQ